MEPTEENIRAFEAAHKARADPAELPPPLQARERPSGRKPVGELVREGPFAP